ncbi:hypothetical protein N0B44_13270 [Roseibacterium beibuensis]|uniref:hypothetical protein n=1 Tax=[Roseibacterium] beibuensis TaxID=1193142 RepID=UPI00217D01F2|nr:hypothetical protein [Roseibacterium beibuensis]MCS6623884.1 hypothetical protein [Roseibacterium beibuensis]
MRTDNLYEIAALIINHNPKVTSVQLASVLNCSEKTAATLRSLWRRADGDWRKMQEMKNTASRDCKAIARAKLKRAA